MANLVGQDIGRYHIVEQLGEGGMAVVYKAYDTRLERDVAIKVIRTDAIPANMHAKMLRRFEREAKALAKLDHLHIVKVFDYGEHDGAPYLVMQYLPSGTLKEKTGQLVDYREAATLLLPIARALDYAHKRDIIHRDVKPANILITEEGEPMLSDFGIAKALESEQTTQLTGTGVGIGTPEYMAPEQWTGKVMPQTDIYALGVVFYELVTGRKPYTADTPAAILVKLTTDPLPRPKSLVPDLPDEVEKVLFKSLAKKPEDRYESMADFAAALEGLVNGKGEASPAKVTAKNVSEQAVRPIESSPVKVTREEIVPTPGRAQPVEREPESRAGSAAPLRKRVPPWIWLVGGGVFIVFLLGLMLGQGTNGKGPLAVLANTTATVAATNIPSSTVTATATQAATVTNTPTSTVPSTATLTPTPALISLESAALIQDGGRSSVQQGISALAFSPSGETLAVGGEDGQVLWLEADSGEERLARQPSSVQVNALSFSPAGDLLAAATEDMQIIVYDAQQGDIIAFLEHESPVVDLHFLTEKAVQFACRNGRFYEWDLGDSTASTRLVTMDGNLMHAAFSPFTGEFAAVTHDLYESKGSNTITQGGVWEYVSKSYSFKYYLWSEGMQEPKYLGSDGKNYYKSENWAGQEPLWGAVYDEAAYLAYINNSHELDIAFSPDGSLLVAGNYNNFDPERSITYSTAPFEAYSMYARDTAFEGTCTGGDITSLAFSPDGSLLASDCGNNVVLWDVDQRKQVAALEGHSSLVRKIRFSPDGTQMVSGDESGNLIYWRLLP